MMTIAADDAQLHYEHTLRPGAPALLMLNSLGASLEMWDDEFAAMSERYELIRYDVRGHGASCSSRIKRSPLSKGCSGRKFLGSGILARS